MILAMRKILLLKFLLQQWKSIVEVVKEFGLECDCFCKNSIEKLYCIGDILKYNIGPIYWVMLLILAYICIKQCSFFLVYGQKASSDQDKQGHIEWYIVHVRGCLERRMPLGEVNPHRKKILFGLIVKKNQNNIFLKIQNYQQLWFPRTF